ncbi:helix-turn-helix domain-containing protein [Paraburkholderia bryophila]|uniref:AraC-like DNA-binding protein n=1 Tax=Paraburkholderia bryophila TaxID=420952 RepID=A0A7Y9WVG8_9BURK|nr:helix-turn-helix domain-containing protein [Paraburkholderia bryophila]NYH26753.1 AraC-like DNA-binding protein [Paraburkholderia bryophila]
MTETRDLLLALKRLAKVDTRPPSLLRVAARPSMFAFVARERERIADVFLPRPSLIVVLEGSKELVTMGRQPSFAAGRAIVLPGGWRGDVVNVPDDVTGFYRALFLDFSEALVLGAHRAHPEWQAQTGAQNIEARLDPLLIGAILHSAEGIATQSLPPVLVDHRIMEILLILGTRGVLPLRPHAAAQSIADAVRTLVRWRPDHPWTADLLSAELGMSNATLRRKLAGEGESLRALLAEERMAAASSMLKEAGVSVRDAALASGYRSSRRFIERFREIEGADPRAIHDPLPIDDGK